MAESSKGTGGASGRSPASARREEREEGAARQHRQDAGASERDGREQAVRARRDRGVPSRPGRYLVAAVPPADGHALEMQLEHVRVLRTVDSRVPGVTLAVIETTADRAAALSRVPYLRVEPDQRLGWLARQPAGLPGDLSTGLPGGGPVAPSGDLRTVTVEVADDAGRPVPDALVWLSGHGLPAVGYTHADGQAELIAPAETAADPEALWVQPARACWPARVSRPRMTRGQPLTAVCERIVTTYPDFPDRALVSWGADVMGFSRLPPTHRGNGVRVVLITSGAAVSHPDLTGRIADGRDIIAQDDKSWQEDPVGSGTHLAVLLGGRDDGAGVVGLAPEAELRVCKTAPGGYSADLIEALHYCIDAEADIALIAVGVTEPSDLLAATVAQAREHGIACIAAAGDGAGPVAYPAALPGVLAVGAIGMLGTFPPGSGLAGRLAGPPAPSGLFAPGFANHGPGLDCCAPGVGIVSGLPPASYGPLDGTAVAAAHVAGIAALVLAHHPRLRPTGQVVRDASRVDRLFRLILASCRPVDGISALSAGLGLPDATVAVGVAPQLWQAVAADFPPPPARGAAATAEEGARAALAELDAAMWSAGLVP